MTKRISLSLLFLVAFIASANQSEAYFTTKQSATKMTETTTLYTVTYKFGNFKYDTYLPVATHRNLDHNESFNRVGYSVRDSAEQKEQTGDTAAIVFSNLEIKNGMYYLPKNKATEFTLTAFFRTDSQTEKDDYYLQVDNLPFPTLIGESLQNRSLNPSELQYYKTPNTELGN